MKVALNGKIATRYNDKGIYELVNDIQVIITLGDGVRRVTMLAGFKTDMRSGTHAIDGFIPKFSNNDLYNAAVLVHDFFYTRNRDGDHYVDKEFADNLLKDMCLYSKEIGSFKAACMYRAVKMFGGSAYYSENSGYCIDNPNYMLYRWDAK